MSDPCIQALGSLIFYVPIVFEGLQGAKNPLW